MCEQSETEYLDGDVVWVKLGSCFWPGEVVGPDKLPPDLLPSFKKPPIAVVKFFQEDTFEYVKNPNSIYKYNCSRKNEFINKGLYMYRTKHGLMEKFPEDVIRAETAVGGDIKILTRDEFQEEKKESYAGLFGDPTKRTPQSAKRAKGRHPQSPALRTPIRKIKDKTNYKVHILLQGSKTPSTPATDITSPSTSRAGSEPVEENGTKVENVTEQPVSSYSTPTMSSSGVYSCHACPFTTTRLNVLIMHNKTHSVTFTPYTPSPVRKLVSKTKSTPKTPKPRKPKQEKNDKVSKTDKADKINQAQKRLSQEKSVEIEVKKAKTDEEIKSSLLADWDDVGEDSNDESTMAMTTSPEVPVGAESPDVPTPAELPSAQIPAEISPNTQKNSEELQSSEKPESSSDSKYEFCEDEDWSMEADAGRKIPRVKNPSKRKESVKSLSIEDDDVHREVAELLNKTTVPELPSVPSTLPVEENFPERSIAKSPDKKNDSNTTEKSPEASQASEKKESTDQPPKTIFKTKTFFRSRHSRSQDAIGKYVAEQLNAAERMDLSENETNGIESSSSPESRESPVENVKVTRLAPKIQLKRMKAEAAQQQEREKTVLDIKQDDVSCKTLKIPDHVINITNDFTIEKDESDSLTSQDLTYSTPEITQENIAPNNLNEELEPPEITEPSLPITCDVTTNKDNFMATISQNSLEESVFDKAVDKEESKGDDYEKNKRHLNLQLDYEHSLETRMNETAVDALLSVSRETDNVTRVISDDPPEDLFEDEKDTTNVNIVNGFNEMKEIIDDKVKEPSIDNDSECSKLQTNSLDEIPITDNLDTDTNADKTSETNDETKITEDVNEVKDKVEDIADDVVADSVPTESDLQIAEALINLPSTAIQNKTFSETPPVTPPLSIQSLEIDKPTEPCEVLLNKESVETVSHSPSTKDLIIEEPIPDYSNEKKENIARYETEHEKSENLNAAQSLVQMSECIDHNINFVEIESENKKEASPIKTNKPKTTEATDIAKEPKVSLLTKKSTVEQSNGKSVSYDKSSSKLLKILEKPTTPKLAPNKTIISKRVIIPGKEKILNFDVGKQSFKGKPQAIKQNIVIRRSGPNKTILNNISEVSNLNKIILSRSNKPVQDGSSVQTYTIQTPVEPSSDPNTILIQPKNRKIGKTLTKIQKIKPQTQTSFVAHIKEKKPIKESGNDESIFDINSMPIVLSDDILTPESIEKMPIVMSDANVITNSSNTTKIKTKTIVESEKIALSPVTTKSLSPITNKAEIKTMVMSPSSDAAKVTTPNILSKSAKLRGAKPMLVIEKATGKKKIILPQSEAVVKEAKQSLAPTLVPSVSQSGGKTEKYIILPTTSSPRATRTQKIVIDPQTGKAHMFLAKGTDALAVTDNKAVSAKLIQQSSENTAPGNTVMIITNSQGAQSKIVLTPEHEKILFPHKANVSQLKTQRITTNSNIVHKPTVSTATAAKGQARIVPRHKSAIITSKGQLIVGGLVPSGTTNIAPMPEIRPALKRIVPAETKKIVHTTHVQKDSSEPVLFYQRKPGTYMQLTAAQFEHLQRTGQLISKSPITQESKVIIQKPSAKSPKEPVVITTSKQRGRKSTIDPQTPQKKAKQEIAIAPAPPPFPALAPALVPALAPVSQLNAVPSLSSNPVATNIQTVHAASPATASPSTYSDLDNIEEILPSTAIARQTESASSQPEPTGAAAPGALSDGQLLAVPGEHFGGLAGTFYLCMEDNGNYTIVDNRPLILENNELVPMAEPAPAIAPLPERRDILEAALANSDVFQPEAARDDPPDFRDLNANVPVLCRVSETSTTLNQPIMTPVEVPTKADGEPAVPAVPANLEDGLAVIGVTPHTVPTSLELPITVTDPRIAPKTSDPLSGSAYGAALLPSPNAEIALVTSGEEVDVHAPGVMTLPLLTDDVSVGKSLPILTDEVTERGVSSVESALGSPSSAEVRDSEAEEGQWARLLTPSSDTSETSAEIPLQPPIKLSVNDLSHSE
ncbi:uncharacterized protein LOC106716376 isoform X1 [Papilio machaon]|uniref:uncharacterized protein LOC106716376 isoform X1 n=1 Tax=Papilio machaon TaxID=76193 RepID=UPI001E663855|nr:uncharacterized protein LOC106716376 isoform X1 [Papilio machaon]